MKYIYNLPTTLILHYILLKLGAKKKKKKMLITFDYKTMNIKAMLLRERILLLV